MQRPFFIFPALTIMLIASVLTATTLAADETTLAEKPILRTQQFESGELSIKLVSADQLEPFLRDLNQRKDYDAQCHCGKPGPDGAYLAKWVKTVTDELIARGYYFDDQGNLHRPSAIVPVR